MFRSGPARLVGATSTVLIATALLTAVLPASEKSGAVSVQHAEAVAPGASGRIYARIPHQTLATYAHVASEVVHARVIGVEMQFLERRLPTTAVRVQLLSALKGTSESELVFHVGGAERPGQRVELVGAPRFSIGEEVVLFLWTEPSTREIGLLGLDQGTYRVHRDAEGIERVTGLHAKGDELGSFFDRVGQELSRPAPWTR